MNRIKQRIHELLEPGEAGDWSSRAVDLALMVLIVANVAVAILETVPAAKAYQEPLWWFEVVSVAIFSVEYVLRIWSWTASGASPLLGRLRYMGHPMLLIDLIAILPFYLVFLGLDLRMARLFRLVRFLRVAKLSRYSSAMQMLGRAMASSRAELLMALLLASFALVLSATMIYYAEHGAQPKVFTSIPASFWWAVTTLTTVGYGDAYPVTLLGKIFGGLSQIIGVGLFALPTGILASAFGEEMRVQRNAGSSDVCPHCGEQIGE